MSDCDPDQYVQRGAAEKAEKLCGWLFHGVTVAAVLVILLPLALYAFIPPFAGKAIGVAAFLAACLERCWAMYLRQGLARACDGAGRDWTAIVVGYAYALTFGCSMAEFFLNRRFPSAGVVVAGALVYGAGVGLRYWAFYTLQQQWHVDVSDTEGPRHLVREGVYRLIRHPLYLGACLEVVGLPAFMGAWGAMLVGAVLFIPFEIARACYEERFLCQLFGGDYRRYMEEVWGFFPLPFTPVRKR